jgi:hypothetical protein
LAQLYWVVAPNVRRDTAASPIGPSTLDKRRAAHALVTQQTRVQLILVVVLLAQYYEFQTREQTCLLIAHHVLSPAFIAPFRESNLFLKTVENSVTPTPQRAECTVFGGVGEGIGCVLVNGDVIYGGTRTTVAAVRNLFTLRMR